MKLELTAAGLDYLSQCMAGGPSPIFCRITIGNGGNAGLNSASMSNPLKDISITGITRDGNFVTLSGMLNNAEIQDRFRETELGVFISNPNSDAYEDAILFAYGYVPEDEAAVIPAATDYAFETSEKIMVYVGATEDVTAILAESQLTATKAELKEHTDNNANPHNVTAEQVGLGNVENKNINDQTPDVELFTNYPDIQTGMTLKEIIGKFAAMAQVLFYHETNCNNPHDVKPGQIGAATKNHNHSTSHMTTGILSVARGGTGVDSMQGLAKAIGKYISVPLFGVYEGDGNSKRLIDLGWRPSAVLVVDSRGVMGTQAGTYGGLAVGLDGVRTSESGNPDHARTWSGYTAILIADNGFYVNGDSNHSAYTNKVGETYHYIAFM